MSPIEYTTKGAINVILLSTWFLDFVDPVIKAIATVTGVVLTIVLIRKALHDTETAKEQTRKLRLENDLKDQELFARMEENKRRFG